MRGITRKWAACHIASTHSGWRRIFICQERRLQQMYELASSVAQFAEGGIGVYDENFLHVDVRGHLARWARVKGQYVGIDALVREPQLLAAKTEAAHVG